MEEMIEIHPLDLHPLLVELGREAGTIQQKFEALDEGTKQTFINDARNLCQRWYALTGGKELNLVSDVN